MVWYCWILNSFVYLIQIVEHVAIGKTQEFPNFHIQLPGLIILLFALCRYGTLYLMKSFYLETTMLFAKRRPQKESIWKEVGHFRCGCFLFVFHLLCDWNKTIFTYFNLSYIPWKVALNWELQCKFLTYRTTRSVGHCTTRMRDSPSVEVGFCRVVDQAADRIVCI